MKKSFVYFVTSLLCISAPALAETYVCSLDNRGSNGWIAESTTIELAGENEAIVFDYLTDYYVDGPISAHTNGNDRNDLRVNWSMNTNSSWGQNSRMRYRARLDKSTMSIVINANTNRYRGKYVARGNCAIQ